MLTIQLQIPLRIQKGIGFVATALGALLRRRTGNSDHGLASVRLQSNGNLAAEM